MENALEVKNLYKRIKNKEIIKDISFNLKYGETLGFIGANGAGKTSTMKCLAGLWHAFRGEILICGKDLRTQFEQAMENCGFLIENPKLYDDLTPVENLQYISKFYKNKITLKDIEDIIETVNLIEYKNNKLKTFSSGMYQRICLATILLRKPELLVLDEPTSALDPKSIIDFRNILIDLKQKYGLTIFISSHNLREIEKLCDRVAIIDKGKIISIKKMNQLNYHKTYKIQFLNAEATQKAINLLQKNTKKYNNIIEITCSSENFQKFINDCSLSHIKIINFDIENVLENDFMEILEGTEK